MDTNTLIMTMIIKETAFMVIAMIMVELLICIKWPFTNNCNIMMTKKAVFKEIRFKTTQSYIQ